MVAGNSEDYVDTNRITYIKGTTTQTHHGAHKLYSQSTRLDDVIGALTMERHSTVSDRIHGTLTQEVTGAVTETYHATLSTTAAGAITITSKGGDITVTSPTAIQLNAPSVTVKGAKVKVDSGDWWDTYGSKGVAGVFKIDATGIKISPTAVKVDATGVATSHTVMKLDTAVFKNDKGALKLEQKGMGFWSGALSFSTFGFKKIG
jgi:hypothetical protein